MLSFVFDRFHHEGAVHITERGFKVSFFFFFFFFVFFIGILLSYKSNKREVTRTKKLPKGSNERDVSTHARKLPTE